MSDNVSPAEQKALLGQTAKGDKVQASDFVRTEDEAPALDFPNGGGAHPLSHTPSPAANNTSPRERQSAVGPELQAEWETATQHLRGVARSQAMSVLPTLVHCKPSTPADPPNLEFSETSNTTYGIPVTSPRDQSLQAYQRMEPINTDFEPFFGCYWCPETGGPCDHCSRCRGCPECFEVSDGSTVQSAQSRAATAVSPAGLPTAGKVKVKPEYKWIEEVIGEEAEETEDDGGEWERDIWDVLDDPASIEQERLELERLEQEREKEMLWDSDDDDSLYSLPKVQGQSQASGAAEVGTVSSASAVSPVVPAAISTTLGISVSTSAVSGAVAPAADTTSADTTSADTTSADTNSADTTPTDTNSADTTPTDTTSADTTSATVAPASGDVVTDALNASAAVLPAEEDVLVGMHKTTAEKGMGKGSCIGIDEGRAAGSASIEQDVFKDDTSSSC